MTNTSKTLIFFGNERLVSGLPKTDTPILRALIEHGYRIAAVVSHHSDSQSRNNRPLEVAVVAHEHNIPVLLPEKPLEIIDQLKQFKAEAAVLVAYGRIIPQAIIDIFPKGIINVHPSLLPQYRGSTPIESAILNGDTQTGISIMQLSAAMDEGPVYTQLPIPISPSDDKFSLYSTVANKSATLLVDILPSILDGSLLPQPQSSEGISYSKQFSKSDAALDTSKYSATECERAIRACLGFPKTKIQVRNHTIVVTKAHVSFQKETPLDIECKDGSILSIDELIGPSGRRMNAKAFLNGYAAG
jgi:methionyl-tRNA formyltransferase